MTFKERLAAEHQESLGDCYVGGCNGCPYTYAYEEFFEKPCSTMSCEECWNREINQKENKMDLYCVYTKADHSDFIVMIGDKPELFSIADSEGIICRQAQFPSIKNALFAIGEIMKNSKVNFECIEIEHSRVISLSRSPSELESDKLRYAIVTGESFYQDYTGQVRLFMSKGQALEYMKEHILDFAFHDSCAVKKVSVNIKLEGE